MHPPTTKTFSSINAAKNSKKYNNTNKGKFNHNDSHKPEYMNKLFNEAMEQYHTEYCEVG